MRVALNETIWLDKYFERLVRLALRGKREHACFIPESLYISPDGTGSDALKGTNNNLLIRVGDPTPLEQLAIDGSVRPKLPQRIAQDILDAIRVRLLPNNERKDKREAPEIFARRRPQPRAKPTTKLEKAVARLNEAEKQVRKYERLLKRANRKVRARRAVVTMIRAGTLSAT